MTFPQPRTPQEIKKKIQFKMNYAKDITFYHFLVGSRKICFCRLVAVTEVGKTPEYSPLRHWIEVLLSNPCMPLVCSPESSSAYFQLPLSNSFLLSAVHCSFKIPPH